MLGRVSSIPTHPNNPQVAVLRFLPQEGVPSSPPLGSMIAELFAFSWWQSPCLNMVHHWLNPSRTRFLDAKPENLQEYISLAKRRTSFDVFVSGYYRTDNDRLYIDAHLFLQPYADSSKNAPQHSCRVEGSVNDVLDVVTSCAKNLLKQWFLPAAEYLSDAPSPVIDTNIAAFELACAGIDFLCYEPPSYHLYHSYAEAALKQEPTSAYLRFTAPGDESEGWRPQRKEVDLCEALLEINAEFLPAYFPYHSIDEAEDLLRAKRLYMEGLRRAPFNTHTYFGLRDICIRLNDTDTLMALCRRHVSRGSFAYKRSEFGDTFLMSAELALAHGQFEMALELCDEGLRISEDDSDAAELLSMIARIQAAQGQEWKALASYRSSLAKEENPTEMLRLAQLLTKLEYYEEAMVTLERLLVRQLPTQETVHWAAMSELARIYAATSNEGKAVELYSRISKLAPSTPEEYDAVMKAVKYLSSKKSI